MALGFHRKMHVLQLSKLDDISKFSFPYGRCFGRLKTALFVLCKPFLRSYVLKKLQKGKLPAIAFDRFPNQLSKAISICCLI